MLSDVKPRLVEMVAVAERIAASSAEVTSRRLQQRLARTHGVSVRSCESIPRGVMLCLQAHSVQAAQFAEHELGELGHGQVWTDSDGVLTLRVAIRANI
jgi:hypothetical protein